MEPQHIHTTTITIGTTPAGGSGSSGSGRNSGC